MFRSHHQDNTKLCDSTVHKQCPLFFQFAKDLEIDYLAWRLWMGVWILVIALVFVATEAAFLVKYVSRFTQEIFAFLISLIFIYETFAKLIKV